MRTVKFYFYKGKSLISRAIEFRTLSIYSHVAIEINGIIYEAWTSDGCNGVVKSDDPLKYHKDGTQFDTIEIQMNNADKWKEFLEMQVGKGYDWKAIFSFNFNKNYHDLLKWFCSELGDTFFPFEVENYNRSNRLISPGDLYYKLLGYKMGLENKNKRV